MRRYHHSEFTPSEVLALKGELTVSVCIPARDEADSVGTVVTEVLAAAHAGRRIADEVVVVDDGSLDGTARVAREAGARVVSGLPHRGKGAAMATALAATSGDIVVFLDADVENTGPHFVTAMVGPLLAVGEVKLVKAAYRRDLHGHPGEGGRVTELVAKPILSILFAEYEELTELDQPLSGECAGWREVFYKVDFPPGYGVELATIVDVAREFGSASIAEVDLGSRVHRNRPLAELAPMAGEIIEAALRRARLAQLSSQVRPELSR